MTCDILGHVFAWIRFGRFVTTRFDTPTLPPSHLVLMLSSEKMHSEGGVSIRPRQRGSAHSLVNHTRHSTEAHGRDQDARLRRFVCGECVSFPLVVSKFSIPA